MELENLLNDDNWKKLGACEISCIGVNDTVSKSNDQDRLIEVNERISGNLKFRQKEKTEIELLKEQNQLLVATLEAMKKPQSEGQSIERERLILKANELGLKFREAIGDEKLLAKIQVVEPEWK